MNLRLRLPALVIWATLSATAAAAQTGRVSITVATDVV
jgi:hypothetical protein